MSQNQNGEYRLVCRPFGCECPAQDWDALVFPGDMAMDRRFLQAVAHAFQGQAAFWNVVVHDARGRPAATAFLSLFALDPLLFVQGSAKALIQRLRVFWPNLLKLPVLMCGCPVSTGQSQLRLAEDADPVAVLRLLHGAMHKLARSRRAPLIVFKEFDDEESARLDSLRSLGYARVDSLPMNYLPAHFDDFDDLCRAMRSRYRNQIQRSRKKFAKAGLRVVHVQDAAEIRRFYTDHVHELYLAVLDRAEVKLEKLPAEFFRELARHFPEDIVVTFAFQDSRVVGFVCSLMHTGHHFNLFCGVDYQVNDESDLYFNLMFQDADFALRRHVQSIHVGQTADDFKSRMGCFTRPRYFFVKARDRLAQPLLQAAAPWFFPAIPAIPPRNLFTQACETKTTSPTVQKTS